MTISKSMRIICSDFCDSIGDIIHVEPIYGKRQDVLLWSKN